MIPAISHCLKSRQWPQRFPCGKFCLASHNRTSGSLGAVLRVAHCSSVTRREAEDALKRYRRNKGSPNHSAVKYESRASARDYILGLKHRLVWNQRSAGQPLSSGFDGSAVICRFAQW